MKNSQYNITKRRCKRLARRDFPAVMEHGVRATTKYFSVVYSKNNSGYAVVVSKKVAQKAVARHRIKRRVRSIIKSVNLTEGCIIFARPGVHKLTYNDMDSEIKELISRVK